MHIECGYYGDAHWPQVRDFKRAIQVGYHTLLAHAKAVAEFRKLALPDGEICIILNLSPVYPKAKKRLIEKPLNGRTSCIFAVFGLCRLWTIS